MTTDWRLHPARHCRGSTLMFPCTERGVAEAIAICLPPNGDPCPVLAECHRYAVERRIQYGIWGGKNRSRNGRKKQRRSNKQNEQKVSA